MALRLLYRLVVAGVIELSLFILVSYKRSIQNNVRELTRVFTIHTVAWELGYHGGASFLLQANYIAKF